MRFWKRAAASVPAAPVPLHDSGERLAADALAARMRDRAAFDLVTARIARDAATPALGKGTPQFSHARF